MKDIKTFLIGFLTCICMFLIMGQTKANNEDKEIVMNVSDGTIRIGNEYGRYQGFANDKFKYMIDTTTGELFYKEGIWWIQRIEPNTFLYYDKDEGKHLPMIRD